MKKLMILLVAAAAFASSPAQAKPQGNNSQSKAAAAKAAAEADKAKKKEEENKMIQENLSALSKYLPKLKESDLHGISAASLRESYYQSFRAQGLNMVDARQKANSLALNWH